MSTDKPAVDVDLAKRQRRVADLAASVNARITSAGGGDDGGGGEDTHMGGGSHKMATESELRAAEIAAAEARTDTKITRMEGKLDLVISKLDGVREDNRSTRANQWVIGFGLAVLIVAVAALFPVFFDMGSKIHEIIEKAVQSRVINTPK